VRSTNELPRSVARARSAVERARFDENDAAGFIKPGFLGHCPEMARIRADGSRYEWARAAAALLAWGLS